MRTRILVVSALVLLLGLFVLSLYVGAYPLTVQDILRLITSDTADSLAGRVFFRLRLPRTLMAALAGAILSLSGGIYQLIFRNPLASPDLTGVASGAACGAAAAILLASGNIMIRMGGAFLGGILSLICGDVRSGRRDRFRRRRCHSDGAEDHRRPRKGACRH